MWVRFGGELLAFQNHSMRSAVAVAPASRWAVAWSPEQAEERMGEGRPGGALPTTITQCLAGGALGEEIAWVGVHEQARLGFADALTGTGE